ncbi:MAG: ParB/RepB/Spo0J family partition protein [Coprobacillus sp.]
MAKMKNVLQEMINDQTTFEATKGKICYVPVEDLIPNDKNEYSIRDIDLLATSIEEGGLLQPILAIKKGNKKVIHTGHRRVKALQVLFNKKASVTFMGKILDEEVPVIWIEMNGNSTDEQISLMRSNSYRNFNQEEKIKIIKKAHELYLSLEEKPKGREREWINALTGISDGTVKTVLADLNKTEEKVIGGTCDGVDELSNIPGEDKIFKKCESFRNYLNKLDLQNVNIEKRKEFNEVLENIIELLSNFIESSS